MSEGCHRQGALQASFGERPGAMLNVLQATTAPETQNHPALNVSVAQFETP